MKYDNLYTTLTDKQFNVFVEIDRNNGIMRMTNAKQYVRVMPIPMHTERGAEHIMDMRQYESEVYTWSKQAWNDNEGQIIRKPFNGKICEGTIEYETRDEYYVRWSGGRSFGVLKKADAGTWYSIH